MWVVGPIKALVPGVEIFDVPTSRFALPAFQSIVTLETGPARPPTVAVDYEGTEPPLELFSCLTLLGFDGLVPQPPPSGAIAWGGQGGGPASTPTILPFRATARAVLGAGTEEVGRALDATTFVLGRLAPDGEASGRSVSEDAEPDTITRRAASALAGTRGRLTALAERPAPAATPTPTPTSGEPVRLDPSPADPLAPPETEDAWDVRVVADIGLVEDTRDLLERHGRIVAEERTSWITEGVYRGQPTETRHRAVRMDVVVEPGTADELLEVLSGMRLRSVEARS